MRKHRHLTKNNDDFYSGLLMNPYPTCSFFIVTPVNAHISHVFTVHNIKRDHRQRTHGHLLQSAKMMDERESAITSISTMITGMCSCYLLPQHFTVSSQPMGLSAEVSER